VTDDLDASRKFTVGDVQPESSALVAASGGWEYAFTKHDSLWDPTAAMGSCHGKARTAADRSASVRRALRVAYRPSGPRPGSRGYLAVVWLETLVRNLPGRR
jgi:hypothetical protein